MYFYPNLQRMEKELIRLLSQNQQDLKESQQEVKKDLLRSLDEHYTVLSARVKEEHEHTDRKVDRVLAHNDKQNGWIEDHAEAITELQGATASCRTHRLQQKAFLKNWKLWIVLTLAAMYGLHRAFEAVSFSQIIEFIKSLIN